MLQIIRHRINTTLELNSLNPEFGVEIDLRSDVSTPGHIHLSHDPWVKGESFVSWLEVFTKRKISGPILLNTKEDLLEARIISLLEQYHVKNYFFIDTTVPTLVKNVQSGLGEKFSVRLSHYEPESFVECFEGKVNWIWADCFNKQPLQLEQLYKFKSKFKICLVSPELHGGTTSDIARFTQFKDVIDAVCTKQPEAWL